MNCSLVDEVGNDVASFFSDTKEGIVASVVALFFVSLLLLCRGGKLVRPLGVVGGGGGAGGATYALLTSQGGVGCEVTVALSVVAALTVASTVACLLGAGVVVVGAGGVGAITHFVYETLPTDEWFGTTSTWAGRAPAYYGIVLAASLLGGALACAWKDDLLRVVSSLLGGVGLATCVHVAYAELSGDDAPSLLLLAVVVGAAAVGVAIQRRSDDAEASTVPPPRSRRGERREGDREDP